MENSNLIVESLKEFNGQVVQTTEYAVQLIPQLIKELQVITLNTHCRVLHLLYTVVQQIVP